MAEIWSDAQAAWVEYYNHAHLDDAAIAACREAFLAGWRAARERSDQQREQEERRRRY